MYVAIICVIYLLVDILYAVVDPRIHSSWRGHQVMALFRVIKIARGQRLKLCLRGCRQGSRENRLCQDVRARSYWQVSWNILRREQTG